MKIAELANHTVFLDWFLHSHGWDTFIDQLGMELVVDNLNPNLSIAERFDMSGAETGLVSLDSQNGLNSILASEKARKKIVLVKSPLIVFNRLNKRAEENDLIALVVDSLDLNPLSQAFIKALSS